MPLRSPSKLSHRDVSPGIGACNPTGEAGATNLPNYTLESAQEDIVSMLEGFGRLPFGHRSGGLRPEPATQSQPKALLTIAGGVS